MVQMELSQLGRGVFVEVIKPAIALIIMGQITQPPIVELEVVIMVLKKKVPHLQHQPKLHVALGVAHRV